MINMETSNQTEYKVLMKREIQNKYSFIFNMGFDKKVTNIDYFIKYIYDNPGIDKYTDEELLGIVMYYFEKLFCFVNHNNDGAGISNVITKERFNLLNNPRLLNISLKAFYKLLTPNTKGVNYLTEYEKSSFFVYMAYLYNNKSIKTSENAIQYKRILISVYKDLFIKLCTLTNDEELSFDILLSCKKVFKEPEPIRQINICLITRPINLPVKNIVDIYILFESSCSNILIQTIIDNMYSIPTNVFMTEQTSTAALDIVEYMDIYSIKQILQKFINAYSDIIYMSNKILRFSLKSISAMSYPKINKAIEELQDDMIFVP